MDRMTEAINKSFFHFGQATEIVFFLSFSWMWAIHPQQLNQKNSKSNDFSHRIRVILIFSGLKKKNDEWIDCTYLRVWKYAFLKFAESFWVRLMCNTDIEHNAKWIEQTLCAERHLEIVSTALFEFEFDDWNQMMLVIESILGEAFCCDRPVTCKTGHRWLKIIFDSRRVHFGHPLCPFIGGVTRSHRNSWLAFLFPFDDFKSFSMHSEWFCGEKKRLKRRSITIVSIVYPSICSAI